MALDPRTGRAVRRPLGAVDHVAPAERVVAVDAKRSGGRFQPAHRLLLHTAGSDQPRTIRAGDLDAHSSYTYVAEWTTPARRRLDTVDVTRLCDDYEVCATPADHGHTFRAALPTDCEPVRRNSHTGYYFDAATFETHREAIVAAADEVTVHAGPHATRRPRVLDGDDFLRLLGWFATEGSVTAKPTSDTVEVKLAQAPGQEQDAIAALCTRLGLAPTVDDSGVRFSSALYGHLLARLCGDRSAAKRLPPVVHALPTRQQRLLLDVLVRGDGDDRGTFYTSSDRLAGDVLRLCAAVGIAPRYTVRDDIVRVSVTDRADGLAPDRNVCRVAPDADRYVRLAVADHPAVLAGRAGRFQWVGTSGVA